MLTCCEYRMALAGSLEPNISSNLDQMRDGKAETATAVAYGLNTATKLDEKHDMVIQNYKRTGNMDH